MIHEVSRAKIVQGLRNLHTPYDVFEHCGHPHSPRDNRARHVPGLGMVCDKGIVATICNHCCVVDGSQSETCVTEHKHLPGYSLCPTMSIVEGRDSPWLP